MGFFVGLLVWFTMSCVVDLGSCLLIWNLDWGGFNYPWLVCCTVRLDWFYWFAWLFLNVGLCWLSGWVLLLPWFVCILLWCIDTPYFPCCWLVSFLPCTACLLSWFAGNWTNIALDRLLVEIIPDPVSPYCTGVLDALLLVLMPITCCLPCVVAY
jgi:hypothetical protein